MTYYFSKTLDAGFDEAIYRATEALKQEGFGIITEISRRRCARSSIELPQVQDPRRVQSYACA